MVGVVATYIVLRFAETGLRSSSSSHAWRLWGGYSGSSLRSSPGSNKGAGKAPGNSIGIDSVSWIFDGFSDLVAARRCFASGLLNPAFAAFREQVTEADRWVQPGDMIKRMGDSKSAIQERVICLEPTATTSSQMRKWDEIGSMFCCYGASGCGFAF